MKRSISLCVSLSCCLAFSVIAHGDPGALTAATVNAARAKKGQGLYPLANGQIITFKNAKSKLCIGVEGGEMINGALLKQGQCNGAPDQKWRVEVRNPKTPNIYYFRNVKSHRCMGVDSGKVTPDANIGQYDCFRGKPDIVTSQEWQILPIELPLDISGDYQIINTKSTNFNKNNKNHMTYCIGVDHAKTTRAQLKQFACDSKPNQAWTYDDEN